MSNFNSSQMSDRATALDAAAREWAANNPAKMMAANWQWRMENKGKHESDRLSARVRPEGYKGAHAKVHLSGMRRHPCWVCGAEKVVAHHADYSRPLDVVFLCLSHHRQLHVEFKAWSKLPAQTEQLQV